MSDMGRLLGQVGRAAQGRAAAGGVRLDRALGDAEQRGGLGDGAVLEEPQHQDRALHLRQLGERAGEVDADQETLMRRMTTTSTAPADPASLS